MPALAGDGRGVPPRRVGGRGSARLRRLDRTGGPLALAALGRLRRTRARPDAPRRIGLMKTTGIGDMVLLSAIVRDVAQARPGAEVVIVAGEENAAVARLIAGATVAAVPAARPHEVLPALRRLRLDALLDFGQWTRVEAFYAALSGARWTAGFASPGQRRHAAYDAATVHRDDVHELDNFRALAATMGIATGSAPVVEPAHDAPVPEGSYAVFHLWPGGFRSHLREWPADRWRELAARVAECGHRVLLTGGPADRERTEAFARRCAPVAGVESIAGRRSFAELVPLLAGAECVVSVNTGVMHLAAAAGARTVALNGPTSSARWGAVGPRVTDVDSALPRCGFLNLGFEYDGRREDCMAGISVDRVAAAALHRAEV